MHKKDCNMGEVGTGPRIREVQVLRDEQHDSREEPKGSGAAKVCKTQGCRMGGDREGDLSCFKCSDALVSNRRHEAEEVRVNTCTVG